MPLMPQADQVCTLLTRKHSTSRSVKLCCDIERSQQRTWQAARDEEADAGAHAVQQAVVLEQVCAPSHAVQQAVPGS